MVIESQFQFDHAYRPQEIETKWQRRWDEDQIYAVDEDDPRPKRFELTMYPYPSGDLHIGHWYAMAPSDAHARFKRMQGYNVLHPMGFDAFGLPAENAAIKSGIHPRTYTMENIAKMRKQLRAMGTTYDWEREVITCEPDYYKWNQWLFLKMYEAGLAYRDFAPANWCPSCNTVLANEQVVDGRCERCESIVTRRELNQWFFRITKYADELLDHSRLEWPDKINTMQTNWIGRSEGVEVEFDISGNDLETESLKTFTTRIDTIFGVTFIVMAPEHPMVQDLTTPEQSSEMEGYIEQARLQTEVERLSTDKEKTGVFTGSHCVNRVSGQQVPIFVADYVLLSYGTGVVMGVPAHDQRDFQFAKKYGLEINMVIIPFDWDGTPIEEAYTEPGKQVNSGTFDGLSNVEAMVEIADYIELNKWGRRTVQYRIRDWLISRQRYWGTPIPIIYCDVCGTVPVSEKDLPVLLPDDAEFRPTGESPLVLNTDFTETECPNCNRPAIRETDTMDTFVDSSWYQFRFSSPDYDSGPFNQEALKSWGPVDQYTGGAEHAVMHLLYARFFTKAMRDMGLLELDEPFLRLFNQGHIISDSQKMSKSRGNVVAPDKYVASQGADVVRCYLMFLGPWEQGGEWSDAGLNGIARWMNRLWDLCQRDTGLFQKEHVNDDSSRELERTMHKTIRRVTEDLDRFKFNTALATLMEYSNTLNRIWDQGAIDQDKWEEAVKNMLILLAPMAPHISEELWERTGHEFSIHNQTIPQWDPQLASDDVITLVVQINGRLRDRIQVPSNITEKEAERVALDSNRVKNHTHGKEVSRIIYVPKKLVNVVVN